MIEILLGILWPFSQGSPQCRIVFIDDTDGNTRTNQSGASQGKEKRKNFMPNAVSKWASLFLYWDTVIKQLFSGRNNLYNGMNHPIQSVTSRRCLIQSHRSSFLQT